jgi:hypothetical protein
MADDSVGGAFDAVGVVPAVFDRAGAGAMSAGRVGSATDFLDRVGESGVEVLRGKRPVLVENPATGLDLGPQRRHDRRPRISRWPIGYS